MVELLALIFVLVVSSSLALFIYLNNPKSATNRMFVFFSVSIVFWAIIMYLSIHPFSFNQTLFFIRLSMLAAIVMSTAVLYLSYTIPNDTFKLKTKYIVLTLIIATIGCITAMSPYMFTSLTIDGNNIEPNAGPGMIMFMVSGLGYSISGLIILALKFHHSHGLVRNQLLFVLIGIGLMHILLIYGNFIDVLIFKTSRLISFGPVFTTPFLIFTAYAILKHRLLDIRFLVARAVAYTLVTFLAAGLFAYALFLIPTFIPSQYETPASMLVALILAFCFTPLKRLIQKLTEGIFHKGAYSSDQLLNDLGSITSSTLAMDKLTRKVLKKLARTMHISRAGFILLTTHGEHKTVTTIANGFDPTPNITTHQIKQLATKATGDLLVFEEMEQGPTKQLLRDQHFSVVMPLEVKDTLHGLLVLGEKSSGDIYTNQDLNVLDIFAPAISVAIQNSLAFQKISRFNITLRKRVNEATSELIKANRHLKHLDKLKDEFVFIATHELKTPVTVMKGYMSMIRDGSYGEVPQKVQEALTEIDQANQQLVQLVNDLLEIARAETKTIQINTTPTPIYEIIKTNLDNLKALAEQKHLKLVYKTLPHQQVTVMADPDRIKEIINNLVSNAIKYSQSGTITISHESNGKELTTHVTDQGYGISDKNQSKVFSRFFRAEETASQPGTGLGLFIVKQIVEKMGGKIWFKSKLGEGTTFSFSLPLDGDHQMADFKKAYTKR